MKPPPSKGVREGEDLAMIGSEIGVGLPLSELVKYHLLKRSREAEGLAMIGSEIGVGLPLLEILLVVESRRIRSFVTLGPCSTTSGGGEKGGGIEGPLEEAPLRVVIAFKSPFGLTTVLLGRGPEPEVHLTEQLELVESELGKSNSLGCDYFLGFDCFELVKNRVVELDELHSEDGVQYFPDYSLLLLKHMLDYYLDILGKCCYRWQDTGSRDVVHHK
ncbi:hypothetical protein Tco_0678222 [Tanacetum coccineum]|uniref:Uncharacterized protein n=1 Tax=Tanacetum coccineum TaxID=301880 RepID=A0ABQ4XEI3_9ASTR